MTVQKANPRARAVALYRKTGFQIIREQMRGQMEEFPPEPEYYMERIIKLAAMPPQDEWTEE
ncbi:MAG: hypothetical protein P1S60_13175 [Anaerolineae bacterium]|nr:hypothetical protein [Anaerolineae bacterium]